MEAIIPVIGLFSAAGVAIGSLVTFIVTNKLNGQRSIKLELEIKKLEKELEAQEEEAQTPLVEPTGGELIAKSGKVTRIYDNLSSFSGNDSAVIYFSNTEEELAFDVLDGVSLIHIESYYLANRHKLPKTVI